MHPCSCIGMHTTCPAFTVRHAVQDLCQLQGQAILSKTVKHPQENGLQVFSTWNAKQLKLLQALTPLSSKPETISNGNLDKETTHESENKTHTSVTRTMPNTLTFYDTAGINGGTSSRYKDISALLSVLEAPQAFEPTELHRSNCCSLSATLKFDQGLGRA